MARFNFLSGYGTQSEAKPRLADVLLRLAEVAIESENYTSAIEDLLKCIHIQKSCLRDDSRSLAETHYQVRFVSYHVLLMVTTISNRVASLS